MRVLGRAVLCIFFYVSPGIAAGSAQSSCDFCVWKTCTPTVIGVPPEQFQPFNDAEYIYEAMKHVRVRKKWLISTLTKRSADQRRAIVSEYLERLNRDIKKDLRDRTHLSFSRALIALVTSIHTFYTKEVHRAIGNKDRITMIEIFTTLPPCLLHKFPGKYEKLFSLRTMLDDIEMVLKEFPKEDYIDVMLSLARGERNEKKEVDEKQAKNDANKMIFAIKKDGWDFKSSTFKEVYTKRSIPQLAETIRQYEYLKRDGATMGSIEKDIKNGFETVQEIYLTITRLVKDHSLYFAEELHKILSIKHRSREDKRNLLRILRGRCDIDLEDIKRAYQEKFKRPLSDKITEGVSVVRSYHRLLLAIVSG